KMSPDGKPTRLLDPIVVRDLLDDRRHKVAQRHIRLAIASLDHPAQATIHLKVGSGRVWCGVGRFLEIDLGNLVGIQDLVAVLVSPRAALNLDQAIPSGRLSGTGGRRLWPLQSKPRPGQEVVDSLDTDSGRAVPQGQDDIGVSLLSAFGRIFG